MSVHLVGQFFVGRATAHRLETAITAEHLHDDRWGRALDAVWETGLSGLLMTIARPANECFSVSAQNVHLDFSRFSVTGAQPSSERKGDEFAPLKITAGDSKDHWPELKQFWVDVIYSNDGDVHYFCG
ncbi:MAG: DUF4277 domain-containing protein [Cyanobacteria bacterium P01_H01_bin.152]